MDEEAVVELTTFTTVGDAYVYAPLPPATSYGHRAEAWNPDKWLQEVKLKVITAGDSCFVRMLTKDTADLFAECPLPADGTPLTTAVEPVVDSSRYFVLRVVDRESRNHAFVGVGFRDRNDASDFTAALDDYRQFLRRKQEAEVMRREFEGHSLQQQQQQQQDGDGDAAAAGSSTSSSIAQKDFSLKPGETLHIKLSPSLKRADSGSKASILRSSSNNSSSGAPAGVVPRLAPPGSATSSSSSSSGFFRLQPPPPPGSSSAVAQKQPPQQEQQRADAGGGAQHGTALRRPSGDGGGGDTSAAAAEAAADEDEEWGAFVG